MRVMIAGPPKTGNVWVKHILAECYDLAIRHEGIPDHDMTAFRRFVESGDFADGSIFHDHFYYSPEFRPLADSIGCHIVTVIRDPYDMFVSYYHYIQRFSESFILAAPNSPESRAVGKAIDSPEALLVLKSPFGWYLLQANQWMHSGDSAVVRYEELHDDPVGAVQSLTARIEPVDDARIHQALAASAPSAMRQKSQPLPPAPSLSRLARTTVPTQYSVEVIHNTLIPGESDVRIADDQVGRTLRISGWAVDTANAAASPGVYISVDGQDDFWAPCAISRPDVAAVLGNARLEPSGFAADIPISAFPPGTHIVTVKVVTGAAQTYSESRPFTVTVT